MEEGFPFHYTLLEFLLVLVGLLLFLLDVVLDIWTVVLFYQDGYYLYMALMITFLLGSSVLSQIFSWVWYSESMDKIETRVETFAKRLGLIKPFHFFQLGVFLRYSGVMEISANSLLQKAGAFPQGVAVFMNHDLQMLRLFETFSESVPQLVLMIAIIVQRGDLRIVTGLKALASAAAIACSVAMYHRSMRSFLPEKRKMSWASTWVYFLWTLLLIVPRVCVLALFSSTFPCYIFPHFFSFWMLLVLGVWSQKTDFMESRCWEWLYRATVGLIWYFSWFNVSKGNTKIKAVVYYSVMGMDTLVLLGFWCWKSLERPGCSDSFRPYTVIPFLIGLHLTGILLRLVYYRWLHPNVDEQKLNGPGQIRPEELRARANFNLEETDSNEDISPRLAVAVPRLTGVEKRMKTLAANFYL